MGRTVLIVDDHAGFRASARRLLEAHGYEVAGEAADGADGIRAARSLRPQVVLLDVHLPDMCGLDVAARLFEDEAAPAVVLTSTRDAADFADLISHTRCRGFIPKEGLSGASLAALLD